MMDRWTSRCMLALAWSLALTVSGAAVLFAPPADAAIVTVSGAITQSVGDDTRPALSNPSLNAIEDAQAISLSIDLGQPWAGAGRYALPGTSVDWQDPAAGTDEPGFAGATLLIEEDSANLHFTLLACLLGSDCETGNALSAIFEVALDLVWSDDAPAIGLAPPHSMQLLPDDGATKLHSRIDRYSFAKGTRVTVPAPGMPPTRRPLGDPSAQGLVRHIPNLQDGWQCIPQSIAHTGKRESGTTFSGV